MEKDKLPVDGRDLLRDFRNGLLPGNPDEIPVHFFQRVREAVGVVLVVGDACALDAQVSLAARVGLVAPDLPDAVAFDLRLEAAVLRTEQGT